MLVLEPELVAVFCDIWFAISDFGILLSAVCAVSSPCVSTLTIWTGVSRLKLFRKALLPVGFGSPEAEKVHRNSPIHPEKTVNNVSSSTSAKPFPESFRKFWTVEQVERTKT